MDLQMCSYGRWSLHWQVLELETGFVAIASRISFWYDNVNRKRNFQKNTQCYICDTIKSPACRVLQNESDVRQFIGNPFLLSLCSLLLAQMDAMITRNGISQPNSSLPGNSDIQSGVQEERLDEPLALSSTYSGEANGYHNTSSHSHSHSRSRSYSRTPEREYERERSISRSRSRSGKECSIVFK